MRVAVFLPASAAGLLLCGTFLSGCGDASEPSPQVPAAEQPALKPKSTAQTVIEGVTGKAAVDQGLSARDKLRVIDAQRRKDMEALDK